MIRKNLNKPLLFSAYLRDLTNSKLKQGRIKHLASRTDKLKRQ